MTRLTTEFYRTFLVGILVCLAGLAVAHGDEKQTPDLQVQPLRDGIFMLSGSGGNIGVLIGSQGNLMIDDQYPQESEVINSALKGISDKPLTFLLNTHWHGDHTGGNAFFSSEENALIVAHENVRKRLVSGGEIPAFKAVIPPAKLEALPVVTYSETMGLHWNGQTIELIHTVPAHTDGDTVIYFNEANVVHTGDLFFNGFYPFIDASSGGSIRGMIAGVASILARIDDETLIIPGHGQLARKSELVAYREMLETAANKIGGLKVAGKSRDQVVAMKPTMDLDVKWGKGFLAPDVWTGIVYDSLP